MILIQNRISSRIFILTALLLFVFSVTAEAQNKKKVKGRSKNYSLGGRIGIDNSASQFLIGGQGEFGRVAGSAVLAPSLDFSLGGDGTAANLDLRWYLLPLPESGLTFYGAAGPTLFFTSGKGASSTEFGLSLTAGMKIPMRGGNKYNFEVRFGFGDIPDLRFMFGILFGI
ncbi:MAG: hypothetical protein IIA17_10955 [candidate division Zixibacteria bacterium]|nr:hypothetical protein [candidate division Zixibacteria bacterium]